MAPTAINRLARDKFFLLSDGCPDLEGFPRSDIRY
jgi:hypothetical protein